MASSIYPQGRRTAIRDVPAKRADAATMAAETSGRATGAGADPLFDHEALMAERISTSDIQTATARIWRSPGDRQQAADGALCRY